MPENNFLHNNQGVVTYYCPFPPHPMRMISFKIRDLLKSFIECFGYNVEKKFFLEIIEVFNIFIEFMENEYE